jgi:2-polyprenyl-6-methoxyphenol hydroxylase-like FAD-dependent oxidoreductase
VRKQGANVVIVGGGMAGCAAAIRLARSGYGVTVLEKETAYQDRVRGECMVQWGFEQAIALGIADVLLETPGASFVTRLMGYDETLPLAVAQSRPHDVSRIIEGVPGLLCAGHVDMRKALANEAVRAGAKLLRGAQHVNVKPGKRPTVSFEHDGIEQEITGALVLVADGKNSRIRKQLGIDLFSSGPRACITGMLIDDGGLWDRAETTQGVFGENLIYIMPRGDNLSRLYVTRTVDNPDRFAGVGKEQRMLDCLNVEGLPFGAELSRAKPAGPCGSFIADDSWTHQPFVDGIVLMGDTAGWSNPVTGQGLAIALRDARIITDLFLDAKGVWNAAQSRAYADERNERMGRLRYASALMDLITAHGQEDRALRRKRMFKRMHANPLLAKALEACHLGPWTVAENAFAPSNLVELAMA